jgi:uncharacterized damage-inducible protein DinB
MSIKEAIIAEIKQETANTRMMLAHIEDKHLTFKPHEKSMNLGALAAHIVELHNWVAFVMEKDQLDFHTDYVPFLPQTAEELLQVLDSKLEANIAAVEALADDQWNTIWSLKAGAHIITSMPRAAVLRYIVQNHLIHHRGQLSVYLRLNDIPVPGIYGPSADEKQ